MLRPQLLTNFFELQKQSAGSAQPPAHQDVKCHHIRYHLQNLSHWLQRDHLSVITGKRLRRWTNPPSRLQFTAFAQHLSTATARALENRTEFVPGSISAAHKRSVQRNCSISWQGSHLHVVEITFLSSVRFDQVQSIPQTLISNDKLPQPSHDHSGPESASGMTTAQPRAPVSVRQFWLPAESL